MANNVLAELTHHFTTRHLHPTPAWLQSFIATTRPNTPLPALKQTALFRLLATDITTSLAQPPNTLFPPDIVLDVEDIGHSRWSQVESIQAKERGETTQGREIVRLMPGEDDGGPTPPAVESKGPFKLLLQDAKGVRMYAFDLRGIEGLNTNMAMGVKLLLRNVDVRRGVAMLEPGNVQVLGGKVDALDKAWKEGRKERLIAAAKAGQEPR